MTCEAKPGDVVTLKSGGPLMTVETVVDGVANCVWFSESENALESAGFRMDALCVCESGCCKDQVKDQQARSDDQCEKDTLNQHADLIAAAVGGLLKKALRT